MSFHFQPQADSSDEEGLDISAWQSASKSQTVTSTERAPVAVMQAQDEEAEEHDIAGFMEAANDLAAGAVNEGNDVEKSDEEEEDDADAFEIIGVVEKRPSGKSVHPPVASSGFTSINVPIPRPPTPSSDEDEEEHNATGNLRRLIPIIPRNELDLDERAEFEDYTTGGDVVSRVLKEIKDESADVRYKVEFENWSVEVIPFEELLTYDNGQEALTVFESQWTPETTPETPRPSRMSLSRPGRKTTVRSGFVNTVDAISDDEDTGVSARSRKRKRDQNSQYFDEPAEESENELEIEDSDDARTTRRRRAKRGEAGPTRSLRSSRNPIYTTELQQLDGDDSDDALLFESDLLPRKRKSRLTLRGPKRGFVENGIGYEAKPVRQATRQSGRATRHQAGMEEVGEDAIFRSDSDEETRPTPKPKAVGAREVFKTLPRNDEFRIRHIQECETCGQGVNYAPLVYCQGCTLAYHKSCIGRRNVRDHLVTKVGDGESVLQCRRCVAVARRKDPTAPDQGRCADCREHGNACLPFRPRKSVTQEQRERDDNDGEDPIYDVDASRISRAENVLFRCLHCWRVFHFEHLPSRSDIMDMDAEVDAEQRFREYSRDWRCKDCLDMPAKVSVIVAWKPIDEDNYDPAVASEDIEEDEKAYLVKWDSMSYLHARWMPGAWVWGVTLFVTRKAFAKRADSQHPKMRAEDAIPEDFLRTDIVLDVKYTNVVQDTTEAVDLARIGEIDKALIKYKGLGYEDAVWEAPPRSEDEERWSDFVGAYNDWVQGRYVRVPRLNTTKSRLEKARKQDFSKMEKHVQPENVVGGQLMHYQIEGLNWLYYKWFTQKNAILADEMGLGKTIQIIGFLATLVVDWSCFPFLIVVPNSTCPNWRREIKRWAPSLRVVAYYGSRESRDLAYKHELYPENAKDLRCHVVVTSYDAAADPSFNRSFKNVPWQALVVDEGQRLKNDKGLLYSSLSQLKVPFKILLTGTPLQNNQRELFNLLHFLDESHNAVDLEQEYSELDSDKIVKLHNMIRPFFLRRTKAQVLTFLPPMAQIIVPVSMTFVQKKLYRTILAKNPELIKAIFTTDTPATKAAAERGSLNNILMQLRKCLCHPFVYSNSIEERNVSHAMSHRNLVDASSKLKLLEILLPKLKERGHRVLIFTQFLDMLDIVEDFLDGQQLRYQRLDGSINALAKQKRIDEFNAPDSPLFAFLLSTRAGGVGINLATADTVIILDPDFNPHQDIQALSRAHRIGQNKKVLCFQLVTRASAEERVMQIGRKKLALDHVLIQELDTEDAEPNDLVSVLRHGAGELFEDNGEQDINYDGPSVDRLLDRSHMEDTSAGADKSAEAQFSFARVWANDQGALQDEMAEEEELQAPNQELWANILKERERVAAQEAAARAVDYGRGRRARGTVDYNNEAALEEAGIDVTPVKQKKARNGDESDTDFLADVSDDDDDNNGRKTAAAAHPAFKRANVSQTQYIHIGFAQANGYQPIQAAHLTVIEDGINCIACRTFHLEGMCPLKLAGVEYCNLCGLAHFGAARLCPHTQSETQVRQMLEDLRHSTEPEHLVAEAKKYLKGLKGSLVHGKKQKQLKKHAAREAQVAEQYAKARAPVEGWMG